MASPKAIMSKIPTSSDSSIKELISRAFSTRNLLHFKHWNTKSFAEHGAVGGLYDAIIEDIDEIVEVYQGKFGLLTGLTTPSVSEPADICAHVKQEAQWVESNRSAIACGTPSIENLVDTLVGHYHKTVYKLENLK